MQPSAEVPVNKQMGKAKEKRWEVNSGQTGKREVKNDSLVAAEKSGRAHAQVLRMAGDPHSPAFSFR